VNRHLWPESCDLLGEVVPGFLTKPGDPLTENRAHGVVQTRDLVFGQALSPFHRRQLCPMKDFIRVRVANAAENAWARQGAFGGVNFAQQRCAKGWQVQIEDFESTRVVRG